MNNTQRAVAKRYAQAFLQTGALQYSAAEMDQLAAWGMRLQQQRAALLVLNKLNLAASRKIEKLIADARIQVQPLVQQLVALLVVHARIDYLPVVLEYAVALYRQQHNSMVFTLTSSHELSSNQMTHIQQFIASLTGAHIVLNQHRDVRLIAGVRVQSDTLLWEHSVRKQLRTLYALLS